ncbi:MAG: NUDIX hydrolase [Phaeodactylibacter sp.]|nr:NUDIX hydrolase [Phaeodactylibacter sp.]
MPPFQVEELHPGLSIDCVIFGFHENELKVLLLKLKNLDKWALPGGFVEKGKDVDEEAARVPEQRSGLKGIFLRQFHLFGSADRNDKGHAALLVEKKIIPGELKGWFEQRFVSVGYFALVEYSKVEHPKPDYTSEACEWRYLKDLPDMILDHKKIVAKAHEALKKELNYQPVGLDLLPDQFTMPELQALYETILEKQLDRRNFRRKILSYDILIPTDKHRTGVRHKAPLLYEFDREKYRRATLAGLNSGW